MKNDGSEVKQITYTTVNNMEPVWSPEGNRIAFQSDRSGIWEIYNMNIDGSNVVKITDIGTNSTEPAWSPDGSQIVFMAEKPDSVGDVMPFHDLYVFDTITHELFNITKDFFYDFASPNWTP